MTPTIAATLIVVGSMLLLLWVVYKQEKKDTDSAK